MLTIIVAVIIVVVIAGWKYRAYCKAENFRMEQERIRQQELAGEKAERIAQQENDLLAQQAARRMMAWKVYETQKVVDPATVIRWVHDKDMEFLLEVEAESYRVFVLIKTSYTSFRSSIWPEDHVAKPRHFYHTAIADKDAELVIPANGSKALDVTMGLRRLSFSAGWRDGDVMTMLDDLERHIGEMLRECAKRDGERQ